MTPIDVDGQLEVAVRALAAARKVIRAARQAGVSVLDNRGRDLKISTDIESERRILEVLAEGSSYPVLAEESASEPIHLAGPTWVVDPLDGSVNYFRDIPLYCVAVALLDDETPVLGALLDVERDRVYTGIPGKGAWLGNVEEPRLSTVSVRQIEDPRAAILATGLPVARDFHEGALMSFIPWFQQFKKVRMFGTAGLSLLFLASGRVDAYAEDGIKIWDVAAGVAVVRGAGGHVRMHPSPGTPFGHDVRAAGSPLLWDNVDGAVSDAPDVEKQP